MRIIKYGNRKLYSREKSRYITLADVVTAVKHGETVHAETKQGVDVTTAVLAQALSGEIASGAECTPERLAEVIRSLTYEPPAPALITP